MIGTRATSGGWRGGKRPPGRWWPGLLAVAVGLAFFLPGIDWGLPSREADHFLFGERRPWTGREIQALAGPRQVDASQGADVDANPLQQRDQAIVINETDAQRAEIVRRYRLFTHHPDEMVSLMALARMRPRAGQFDPGLYQYGGYWIYPLGGLIGGAAATGLVQLTSDEAYYLDHPEAFGHFYLLARLYVVAWAVAGMLVVASLAERLGAGRVKWAAALTVAVLPVVVNMAHEAKPHLPGAVLMLLAVRAAMQYAATADRRWWYGTAILCGLAVGTVLTAWPAVALIPLVALTVRQPWLHRLRDLLHGLYLAALVYAVGNPYVISHLLSGRPVLASNLGNTRAMFIVGLTTESLNNACSLIMMSVGVLLGWAAVACLLVLPVCYVTNRLRGTGSPRPRWGLLLIPATLAAAQFVYFAGEQRAEYARFSLFIDLALLMIVFAGLSRALAGGRFMRVAARVALVPLILLTALSSVPYVAAFVVDSKPSGSRSEAAVVAARYATRGASTLAVQREPAPYSAPPVDLFAWRIVLLPKGADPMGPGGCDLLMAQADQLPVWCEVPSGYDWGQTDHWHLAAPGRMQWADKPFYWVIDAKYSRPGR